MRNWFLILAAATLVLGGCQTTRYTLRPPASDAGRSCITQCTGIREACRGNEIRRVKNERESCEHRAERSLQSCIADADNKKKKKECEKQKPSCWANEDYDRCDEDYRICYQQCGGTVIKTIK